MKTVTIKRGADGFGSQVLSIISGIAYAKKHGMKYIHTPINSIKLVNMSEHKNDELIRANDMLNNIMIDMGFEVGSNADIIEPFFHKDILNNGVSFYYTDLLMEELQKLILKILKNQNIIVMK